MRAPTILPAILLLLPAALAARITLLISASTQLPNPATLPPSTHATLSGPEVVTTAPLNRRNSFVFDNVTAGSYLATIQCRDYSFEPLRIDVSDLETGLQKVQVWQTFRGNEWDNLGEKKADGTGEVVVDARALMPKEYYQERTGFSPMSFLKNPMILMALVSMGLVFGMPKLIENMDEETRAEYEAMKKQSTFGSGANPASSLQNFDMASWLAGKAAESSSSGPEPKPAAAPRKK